MFPDILRDTDVSVRLLVANSRNDFGITLQKRKGMDWRDGQQLTELIEGLESDGGKAGRMEETGGQAAGGTVSGPARPLLRAPRCPIASSPQHPNTSSPVGRCRCHAWLALPGPGI